MKTVKEVLAKYEPAMRRAFMASIAEITSQAQIGQVIEALDRGDITAAVDALFVDKAAFEQFEALMRAGYADGGKAAIAELGTLRDGAGTAFVVRFDGRNARAEHWLKVHSSDFITRITEEQRQLVRTYLTSSFAEGRNPRSTALDLVGRINKTTKKREGGIIGLSRGQLNSLATARLELENGDFGKYLDRKLRDGRLDGVVLKAQRNGKPLSTRDVSRLTNRLSNSMLRLRGETIARTETLAGINAAQHEALQQITDTGKIKPNQVRRVWDSAGDKRVRSTHVTMDGQSVGLTEKFVSPSGARLLHPGDKSAPAGEIINCRCIVRTRIDFLANVR